MSGIQAIIPIANKGPNKNELTTVQAVRATNSRELRGGISNMPISAAMAAGMPNASAIFKRGEPAQPRRSGSISLLLLLTTPHPCLRRWPGAGGAGHGRKSAIRAKLSPALASRATIAAPTLNPTLISEPAMKPWTRRQPAAQTRAHPGRCAPIVIWPRSQPRRARIKQSSPHLAGDQATIRPVDRIRSSDLTELRDI